MGINYVKTNVFLGHVGTTRVLTISTGAPQVFAATTGTIMVSLMNNGSGAITMGDSSITINLGDVIHPFASRDYYPVSDGFYLYFQAISVASVLSWTDFYTG